MSVRVHFLREGRAACGLPGEPVTWPIGETWIYPGMPILRPSDVCPWCREAEARRYAPVPEAPPNQVTSVRVETKGTHDHVTLFLRGANAGTLTVDQGDGERLAMLLGLWQVEKATDQVLEALNKVRAVIEALRPPT